MRIIAISEFACRQLGRPRDEQEGRPLDEVAAGYHFFGPDGRPAPIVQLPVARACRGGERVVDEQWLVEDPSGRRNTLQMNAEPVFSRRGKVIGGIASWTDISAFKAVEADLRATLEIEEVLLREANHRIKNQLELVAGLVRMEALNQGPEAARLARIIEDKLTVLAAAHEGFLASRSSRQMSAKALIYGIVKALETPNQQIVVDVQEIDLAAPQVTPLALIVNEAISNALKHAFPGDRNGTVTVSLHRRLAGRLRLTVADDGVGLADPAQTTAGLGLRIITVLAGQLKGEADLVNGPFGGAQLAVEFPEA